VKRNGHDNAQYRFRKSSRVLRKETLEGREKSKSGLGQSGVERSRENVGETSQQVFCMSYMCVQM
jgi:hypothetical protein